MPVSKDRKTSITKKKALIEGETLLEVSFGEGSTYQGCLISIVVDLMGRPTIDIYKADKNIRVLVPTANLVVSTER